VTVLSPDPPSCATGTEAPGGTPPPPLPAGPPDVVAAGVLCWRRSRDGGIEVLLVHRPGCDDWSWPKGKPERRESLAECAVREALEKIGVVAVLGRPLPPVRYLLPDGLVTETSYWAARAVSQQRPTAERAEVDVVEWVPLDVAAERVTHASDAGPLCALADFADSGTLATAATLIIRHATARPRDSWARADSERPLVASGKRQAMALAALLQCWRPDYVISSPWRRCMQSMDPYAAASGVRIRTKGGLSEDGFRRGPGKAHRHTTRLLDSAHGGALCTHRPVLAGVMAALRERCLPEVTAEIPDTNPFLHPGEVLVAHVVPPNGSPAKIVAVERHGIR
jgi:8-oxo-dGTP pyrophosphatase MutT (NUDIX family)/phosphohistidine phosphatase SixA